jgi:hypothetical protein
MALLEEFGKSQKRFLPGHVAALMDEGLIPILGLERAASRFLISVEIREAERCHLTLETAIHR